MSERFFHIGKLVYSIANESVRDTAEVLWDKLSPAACAVPADAPAVRFIFRDRLESPGEPVARVGRTAIGTYSITFQEKSRLRMQLYPDARGGLAAVLAEAHYPFFREIGHFFNKSWKYHFRYGLTLPEGLAQKVLYSALLPMLALTAPEYQMVPVTAGALVMPDGKALLLAGRRGAGRTALIGHLMERGWKFLGDDVVALGQDGTVYPAALPLHIHAHHLETSPALVARMTAAMTPSELSLWRRAFRHGGARRMRWMRAERLWGAERLAEQAPLGKVIFLQRETGRETAECADCPADIAVHTFEAMLMEEFRHIPALCVSTNAAAGAELVPDLGKWLKAAGPVLSQALNHVPLRLVRLPEKPDYAAFAEQIR